MQWFKKFKKVAIVGIAFILFIFVLLPLIGHAYRQHHPVNYPSVIPASQWKFFASKEGGFRVLFPGSPQETNVTINATATNIIMPCFFVWADRQTEYAVNYGDYPKNLKRLSPKDQFDLSQAGVAKKFGNVLIERDYSFENFPARDFEFVVGGKGNFSGKVRLILVDERLYQIMVIFLTKNPHLDDFKNFFDSFSIQKS
jgi:hypothetical protein